MKYMFFFTAILSIMIAASPANSMTGVSQFSHDRSHVLSQVAPANRDTKIEGQEVILDYCKADKPYKDNTSWECLSDEIYTVRITPNSIGLLKKLILYCEFIDNGTKISALRLHFYEDNNGKPSKEILTSDGKFLANDVTFDKGNITPGWTNINFYKPDGSPSIDYGNYKDIHIGFEIIHGDSADHFSIGISNNVSGEPNRFWFQDGTDFLNPKDLDASLPPNSCLMMQAVVEYSTPDSLKLTVNPSTKQIITNSQEITYNISVTDQKMLPVSGVSIFINDSLQKITPTQLLTDASGIAIYKTHTSANLKPGDYSISFVASKHGYTNADTAKRIVSYNPKGTNKTCWYYPNNTNPLLTFCVQDGEWDDSNTSSIKISNKILTVNDFLKFQGDMEITTQGDISFKSNGKFYIENTNIGGVTIPELTIVEGKFEQVLLKDGKFNFPFIDDSQIDEYKRGSYFAGVKIIPTKFDLFATVTSANLGMVMSGEIWFQNTKDCHDKNKRVRLSVTDLTFTESLSTGKIDISFKSSLNGFSIGPLCINAVGGSYSSLEDIIAANISLDWEKVGSFDGGFKLIKGQFDGFNFGLTSAKVIPIPFPPISWAGFKGVGLSMSGLSSDSPSPFEIEGDFTLANVDEYNIFPISELFELKLSGGYKEPLTFFGGADLKLLKLDGIAPWQGIFKGNAEICLPSSTITLSGSGSFGNLGGSDYAYNLDGNFSISKPQSDISFNGELTGSLKIPDFDGSNPILQIINKNKNFKLPYTIASVTAGFDNKNIYATIPGIETEIDLSPLPPLKITILPDFTVAVNLQKKFGDSGFMRINTGGYHADIAQKKYSNIQEYNSDSLIIPFVTTTNMSYYYVVIEGKTKPIESYLVRDNKQLVTQSTAFSKDTVILSQKNNSTIWIIKDPMNMPWQLIMKNFDPKTDSISKFYFEKQIDNQEFSFSVSQNAKTVNVSWKKIDPSATLKFYIDKDTLNFDGKYITTISENSGQFSFSLNDTLPECKYYIHVSRLSNNQLHQYYNNSQIFNNKTLIVAPKNISAVANQFGVTKIIWDTPNGYDIDGYQLKISYKNGKDSILNVVSNDVTITLATNTIVSISLASYNHNGLISCWSNDISIITDINEFNNNVDNTWETIQIFPNPVSNILSIAFSQAGAGLGEPIIFIYDCLGNEKIKQSASADNVLNGYVSVDCSCLSSGVYNCVVKTGNTTHTSKFVIMK